MTLKTLALGSTKLVNLFIFFLADPSGLTLWTELKISWPVNTKTVSAAFCTCCSYVWQNKCILVFISPAVSIVCNSLHCSFSISINIAWKHISHIYVEASIWVFFTVLFLLELEMYISGPCTEEHPGDHFLVSHTLTLFNYLKRPKPFWGLGPKDVDFCCKCWHLNKGFKNFRTFFAHFWKQSQGVPI